MKRKAKGRALEQKLVSALDIMQSPAATPWVGQTVNQEGKHDPGEKDVARVGRQLVIDWCYEVVDYVEGVPRENTLVQRDVPAACDGTEVCHAIQVLMLLELHVHVDASMVEIAARLGQAKRDRDLMKRVALAVHDATAHVEFLQDCAATGHR